MFLKGGVRRAFFSFFFERLDLIGLRVRFEIDAVNICQREGAAIK